MDKTTINRDNFLEKLGFSHVRERLLERAKISHLYAELVDFLQKNGVEIMVGSEKLDSRQLDFKIPSTPIHFNLTSFIKDKIEAFISIFLILDGASEDNYLKIGSGVIMSFMNKVTLLNKKYGELCIVESMAEVKLNTKEEICLNLYGHECRFPKAGCQFQDSATDNCLFDLDSIEKTLEKLEEKKVLEKVNAAEPIIWKITV